MRSKFFNIFLTILLILLFLNPILTKSFTSKEENPLVLTQTGFQDAKLYIFIEDQPISTLGGRYQFDSCQESDKFTNTLSTLDIYKDYSEFDKEFKGEILSSSVKSKNTQTTMLLGAFAPLFSISKSPGFCSMVKSIPSALEILPDQSYRYTQDFIKDQIGNTDTNLPQDSLAFYENARFKFIIVNGELVEILGYDKSNLDRTLSTIHFSKIEL
jgi:hypothetical protein